MTAYELFARLSPSETTGVLEWLQENDRAAYKTCGGLLAGRRKLRPVFVERKPRVERNAWMAENLGKHANADLANEILQSWLFGAHGDMVCGFLDFLKIPHDGKGLIESLPAEPPADEINKAVEELFSKSPPTAALIYLNLFTSMEMTDWPHLQDLVSTDHRLCRNSTTP